MVVSAKRVIGLPVVSVARGREAGRIKEIIYNPSHHRVEALHIGLSSRSGIRVILIHDAIKIDGNAVLIEDITKVKKAADIFDKATCMETNNNIRFDTYTGIAETK